ncbi:very short patch repair endonuclease [Mesorhizobium sp. M0854]|uniref:very short patch repair endonuclease n=1 Tax=Mesorhizobium sp. M0854 TaxID=2957013 RepID=UPI00333D3925
MAIGVGLWHIECIFKGTRGAHLSSSIRSPRSLMMSKVRSRDTAPEIKVRRLAHALGFRFRLHRRDLPGTPDLVFPRHRMAVFVHGCFWHRHEGCSRASMPSSNVDFWLAKFERNQFRDARALESLERMGWQVHVIWECETRSDDRLREILIALLAKGQSTTPEELNQQREKLVQAWFISRKKSIATKKSAKLDLERLREPTF